MQEFYEFNSVFYFLKCKLGCRAIDVVQEEYTRSIAFGEVVSMDSVIQIRGTVVLWNLLLAMEVAFCS